MINTNTTIRVGNRFLTPKGIGRNGLDVHDCLSELIANSLDWNSSKFDSLTPVKIKIIFQDDNQIMIIDNGAGMNLQELDTAINLAEAEDDLREKLDDDMRKGRYGMGLKIAALTLGWKFKINTVSYKENTKENIFEFDSKKLEDINSTYLENGLSIITLEESDSKSLLFEDFKHGTCITISNLEKKLPSINTVRDEIEERFTPDINSLISTIGLDFQIINRQNSIDVQVLQIKKKDISRLFVDEVLKVDFKNPDKWAKKSVYEYIGADSKMYQLGGFLQILDKRSTVEQNYGLNLYYNGQLIERYHKGLLFKKGRGYERIYGELHLDGCTPDPSKKKFIPDAALYRVKEIISEDLDYFKFLTPPTADAKKKVAAEIDKRKGIKAEVLIPNDDLDDSNLPNTPNENTPETEPETEPPIPQNIIKISKRLLIQISKETIINEPLQASRGVNWESSYLPSKENNDIMILRVYINNNSELFKAVDELYEFEKDKNKIISFYKRIAICECIYDKLIEKHTFHPEEAREITDNKVYPQVLKMTGII